MQQNGDLQELLRLVCIDCVAACRASRADEEARGGDSGTRPQVDDGGLLGHQEIGKIKTKVMAIGSAV